MIETIISNNCAGAAIMHSMGMEFKSPTINLQILPEEFSRFCKYLKHYMDAPLREYTDISDRHKEFLNKMFGGIPNMPFGIIADIIVCFQHYSTFEEAAAKWNERKRRIDYDNIGFIFHARGKEYSAEVEKVLNLEIPHKLALTQDFSVDGAIGFEGEAFSALNGKMLITQVYDFNDWRCR